MRIEINKSGAEEFSGIVAEQTEAITAALETPLTPAPLIAALGRPLVVGECIFDDHDLNKLTRRIRQDSFYGQSLYGIAGAHVDSVIKQNVLEPLAEAFDLGAYEPVFNYGRRPIFKDVVLSTIHVDQAEVEDNGGLPFWSLQIKIPSTELRNVTAYYDNQGIEQQPEVPGYYAQRPETARINPAGHARYVYKGPLFADELDDILQQDGNGMSLLPHVTDDHELSVPIIFNDGFVPHRNLDMVIPEDAAVRSLLPIKSVFTAIAYNYDVHGQDDVT